MFQKLKLLRIGDREQRCRLSKILETTPMLHTLRVMRMDEVGSNELSEIASDRTFWDLKNVDCVKHRLKVLELEPFLGGDVETDPICALKGANSFSICGCNQAQAFAPKLSRMQCNKLEIAFHLHWQLVELVSKGSIISRQSICIALATAQLLFSDSLSCCWY